MQITKATKFKSVFLIYVEIQKKKKSDFDLIRSMSLDKEMLTAFWVDWK